MRTDSPTNRRVPIGAGATALMTLVAIAATVSAAPPAAQIGCTAVMMEQSGVRGVAAAVAAVAREFFGGERQVAAIVAHRPQVTVPTRAVSLDAPAALAASPPALRLGAHLLNLPPPVC